MQPNFFDSIVNIVISVILGLFFISVIWDAFKDSILDLFKDLTSWTKNLKKGKD